MSEASRIMGNLCSNPLWHGTTTTAVVDEICKNYSTFILCNGYGRNVVFTPITENTISYHTVDSITGKRGF
jgi:hypothetical protein